jgi:hypothetical protein
MVVLSDPHQNQRSIYEAVHAVVTAPPAQYFGTQAGTAAAASPSFAENMPTAMNLSGMVPQYGNPYSHGVQYPPPPPRTNPAVSLPYHQAPPGVIRTIYPPASAASLGANGRKSIRLATAISGPPVPAAASVWIASCRRRSCNGKLLNIDPRLVDLPSLMASAHTDAPGTEASCHVCTYLVRVLRR